MEVKEGEEKRNKAIMGSRRGSLTNLPSLIRHTPAGGGGGGGERDERRMIKKRDGGRNTALGGCKKEEIEEKKGCKGGIK